MDKMKRKCQINGKITGKSSINELSLKYKIKGECDESHILFDNKSNIFCHIISDIITDSIIDENDIDDEGQNDEINTDVLIPRRVIFVIDRSGSMSGSKWNKTISATIMAIKQLRNGYDRFGIILFDHNIKLLPYNDERGCTLSNDKSISDSIQALQNETVGGSTNINDALLKAVELIKIDILLLNNDANYRYNFFMNQLIFITDGEANNGERDTNKIISNIKNANELSKIDKYNNKICIFSFGVGSNENDSNWTNDLNHSFLKLLSLNNNGFYQRIKSQSADTSLGEYFKILSKPVLSNINIKYKNKNIKHLTETKFNTLYSGNDLIICGKVENTENLLLTISATTGKQIKENDKLITKPINITKEMKVDITPNDNDEDDDEAINNTERIWAYLKLQQFATKKLIYPDMIEMDDDEKKQDRSLPLSLALKYKFVTPWTSMIVVKQKNIHISQQKEQKKPISNTNAMGTARGSKLDVDDENDEAVASAFLGVSRQIIKTAHEPPPPALYCKLSNNLSIKPRMRPGMKGRSTKSKPTMERLKTVWITSKTPPFKSGYQVGQQIGGYGQFGKSYRCKRKKDKKIFAVKCISKARFYRIDRSAQRRQALLIAMQGETDIMRRLKHKYIVSMEEMYEDKHTLYIVMEECKGGNLFDRIKEKSRYNEKNASLMIRMILEALFYMHQYHRVVHCNLSSQCILFVNKSDNSPIKILDFGMSKVLPRLRSLDRLCHAPYYTSPEVIKGDYAHCSDMWSVGVIMFMILYGFPPFYVDPTKYYGQHEAQIIYRLIQKGIDPTVKQGFGAWFPKEIPVSDESKDLMARLMDLNTSKRLTAKEALQHPWILNQGVSSKQIKQENEADTDEKHENEESEIFTNFATLNQFKCAISRLFSDKYTNMTPEHFKHLIKLFNDLDIDGTINYEEFKNAMLKSKDLNLTNDDINKFFVGMNTDKIRKINFKFLVNALVHDYLIVSDQILYEAFRDLDDDEDGKIKTLKLKEKIKQINIYGNKENELIKILDSLNLDDDDSIDYEEFLRRVHPNFNQIPKWFWS